MIKIGKVLMGIVVGILLLLVVIVVFIMIFDWNCFKLIINEKVLIEL